MVGTYKINKARLDKSRLIESNKDRSLDSG